jgi:hypothetical protein
MKTTTITATDDNSNNINIGKHNGGSSLISIYRHSAINEDAILFVDMEVDTVVTTTTTATIIEPITDSHPTSHPKYPNVEHIEHTRTPEPTSTVELTQTAPEQSEQESLNYLQNLLAPSPSSPVANSIDIDAVTSRHTCDRGDATMPTTVPLTASADDKGPCDDGDDDKDTRTPLSSPKGTWGANDSIGKEGIIFFRFIDFLVMNHDAALR